MDGLKEAPRSPESVNIFDAPDPHRSLFVAFWRACRCSRDDLRCGPTSCLVTGSYGLHLAEQEIDLSSKSSLVIDEELHLTELTLETLKSFDRLSPFGMDNKKPVFWSVISKVEGARSMGAGNTHLKLKISQKMRPLRVVAFGLGSLETEFAQAQDLELAVQLSVNQWNGQTTLQLMLVDARVDGVQLFNIRSKNASLPAGVPVLDFTQELPDLTGAPAVVVGNIPWGYRATTANLPRAWFASRLFQKWDLQSLLSDRIR